MGSEMCIRDRYDPLYRSSQNIRTFTEGADSQDVELIRDAIDQSQIVMFMGFGFHNLNMQLLFGDQKFEQTRVLATGYGLSENSLRQIEYELSKIFQPNGNSQISIINKKCSELIHEFERYLST